MAKIKVHEFSHQEAQKIVSDFIHLISCLKTKQDIIGFFIGLMTPSEALMFARRIQIAKALLQEKNSYENIRSKLKVSFQTITKIDRWLHSGDDKRDQWLAKEIIKLDDFFQEEKRKPKISPSPLNRYPEHRMMKELLANLLG